MQFFESNFKPFILKVILIKTKKYNNIVAKLCYRVLTVPGLKVKGLKACFGFGFGVREIEAS